MIKTELQFRQFTSPKWRKHTAYGAVAVLQDAFNPGRGVDTLFMSERLGARDTVVDRGATRNVLLPLSNVHRHLDACLRRHHLEAHALPDDYVEETLRRGEPILCLGTDYKTWLLMHRLEEKGKSMIINFEYSHPVWINWELVMSRTLRCFRIEKTPFGVEA